MSNFISNFYEKLPKKRVSTAALFFNQQGDMLIVKPAYLDAWLIPGGAVDTDESPRQGCIREVREELQLTVEINRLLCIDYTSHEKDKSENLIFIFYGGVLTPAQLTQIRLPSQELTEYRFVPVEEALTLLTDTLAKRIPYCIQGVQDNATGTTFYLEDAVPVLTV